MIQSTQKPFDQSKIDTLYELQDAVCDRFTFQELATLYDSLKAALENEVVREVLDQAQDRLLDAVVYLSAIGIFIIMMTAAEDKPCSAAQILKELEDD